MKIKQTAIGLATFTLLRMGKFTVKTSGNNHCGTNDVLSIQYKLEVRCTADSLDSRGFLFDQTKADLWFSQQKYTALSCEQYTVYCGREIYKMIRKENPNCKIEMFSLTLSPEPHMAQLTFCYGDV